MIGKLRAFGRFWFDFIVGDDWRLAAGVVCGLVATYAVSRSGVPAWWVLPGVVAALIAVVVWPATRRR